MGFSATVLRLQIAHHTKYFSSTTVLQFTTKMNGNTHRSPLHNNPGHLKNHSLAKSSLKNDRRSWVDEIRWRVGEASCMKWTADDVLAVVKYHPIPCLLAVALLFFMGVEYTLLMIPPSSPPFDIGFMATVNLHRILAGSPALNTILAGLNTVFVGMQTAYIIGTWVVEGRPRATIAALLMFTFRGILGYSTQLPLPQVSTFTFHTVRTESDIKGSYQTPRTPDRVRHQRQKNESAIFIPGPSLRQNIGPSPWSAIKHTDSGPSPWSESESVVRRAIKQPLNVVAYTERCGKELLSANPTCAPIAGGSGADFPVGNVSFFLFYSGHVAASVIASLDMRRMQRLKSAILFDILNVLQFVRLLSSRGHYTIDLVVGIGAGILFDSISGKYILKKHKTPSINTKSNGGCKVPLVSPKLRNGTH
ncbi:hypothetical protein LXL04_032065 [Taraxacum kok-saghyz]